MTGEPYNPHVPFEEPSPADLEACGVENTLASPDPRAPGQKGFRHRSGDSILRVLWDSEERWIEVDISIGSSTMLSLVREPVYRIKVDRTANGVELTIAFYTPTVSGHAVVVHGESFSVTDSVTRNSPDQV